MSEIAQLLASADIPYAYGGLAWRIHVRLPKSSDPRICGRLRGLAAARWPAEREAVGAL